jgi:L-ribulose-5-phosphate 4-epimerase
LEASIYAAKQDFIKAAQRAFAAGMQSGNGGNISVRVADYDLMAVKASGVGFGESVPERIVVTDFDGSVVEGNLKPTRELVLHAALYREFPQIRAVVHTHSPYAIAWSLTGRDIPLITKHAQLKLDGAIPVLDVEAPDVRASDLPAVYALLKSRPALQVFVLKGHGIVAFDKTALLAEQAAELVEETAKISWLDAIGRRIGLIA